MIQAIHNNNHYIFTSYSTHRSLGNTFYNFYAAAKKPVSTCIHEKENVCLDSYNFNNT
jgi:hypothetical protein